MVVIDDQDNFDDSSRHPESERRRSGRKKKQSSSCGILRFVGVDVVPTAQIPRPHAAILLGNSEGWVLVRFADREFAGGPQTFPKKTAHRVRLILFDRQPAASSSALSFEHMPRSLPDGICVSRVCGAPGSRSHGAWPTPTRRQRNASRVTGDSAVGFGSKLVNGRLSDDAVTHAFLAVAPAPLACGGMSHRGD